jgi:hypothetical protein
VRRVGAVISLRPKNDRGREILAMLEERTGESPTHVIDDGTRRYYLIAQEADITDFDPVLDRIAPDWKDHVDNWRG